MKIIRFDKVSHPEIFYSSAVVKLHEKGVYSPKEALGTYGS